MGNFAFNPFTRNLDLVGTGGTPGSGAIFTITGDVGGPESPDVNGNFNLFSATSDSFTDDGIEVIGSTNTETITLTNRLKGQVSTTDATLTTIVTFALGVTPAVYSIAGVVTCRASTGDGASYFLQSCIRTNGSAATEIGTEDSIFFEDASLSTADAIVSVSGNNVLIRVQGVAATNINWDAGFNFRRVT